MRRRGYTCRIKSKYGVITDWYCRNRKKLEVEITRKVSKEGFTQLTDIAPDYHLSDNDEFWVTFPY